MKKSLVLFIFFLPAFLFAQTEKQELTGALGLTFGMNKTTVNSILTQKGGVVSEASKTVNYMSYSGIKMGTKKADMVSCKFVDDKLYKMVIAFFPELEAKTQGVYDELRSILVGKYGETKSIRNFRGIYSDGDGYEMQAVRTGNADIVSYWFDFKNDNGITLEIEGLKDYTIVALTYEDGILIKEVIKRQDAKNKVEF